MNESKKIYNILRTHREKVVSYGHTPVMTVLVGSQNYDLATENSDYDTFTFVLPSVRDLATMKEPVSTTHEDEFGHINIKDIRLGLNLLKKTNPNSVECFASKYYFTEPGFVDVIERMRNPMILRCDTKHMMMAIGGMSHQLTKRNMPPGKRLSHLLRMRCMVDNYFHLNSNILALSNIELYLRAINAKKDPDNPKWEEEIEQEARIVQEMIDMRMKGYVKDPAEDVIRNAIEDAQVEIIRRVFREDGGQNC